MKQSSIDALITREVRGLRLRYGVRMSSLQRCGHPRQLGGGNKTYPELFSDKEDADGDKTYFCTLSFAFLEIYREICYISRNLAVQMDDSLLRYVIQFYSTLALQQLVIESIHSFRNSMRYHDR
jgi:hypothetical protein